MVETVATITHFLSNHIHCKISIFCPIHNATKLFNPKSQVNRTAFVDGFKLFMIVVGVAAHTMICLEKFIAIGLIRKLFVAN